MLNFLFSLQDDPITEADSEISANRSFLFGDGFFETIRLNQKGEMPLAAYHAGRISRSACLLQFADLEAFCVEDLQSLLRRIPGSSAWKGMKLKLVFYRQGGGGYEPDEQCKTMIFASVSPLVMPFLSRIEKVAVAESIRIFPSAVTHIKSTSSLPYVLAGMERTKRDSDEILLLSPEGFAVEGSFTSLCWEDDEGIHFTPRELGGIDSCSRRFLEDYFRRCSLTFSEKQISPEKLLQRSRWVCFSSALGLRFLTAHQGEDYIPDIFTRAGFENL